MVSFVSVVIAGRAPQGARGLKFKSHFGVTSPDGRAPQGARGLKYGLGDGIPSSPPSRPARGAWIEINKGLIYSNMGIGRAPQGARGLKSFSPLALTQEVAVAPRKGRVD